jgi:opine dehydrogenase
VSDDLAQAIAGELGGSSVAQAASLPAVATSAIAVLGELVGTATTTSGPAALPPAGRLSAPRPGAGRTTVAVLGDEGVAAATAGHLALLGFDVRWSSPRSSALAPYAAGVELVGLGTGHPAIVGSIDACVAGRDLVLVCAHATEHAAYGAFLSSVLTDGQVIVLMPGRTGGALELREVLRAHCCRARVVVAETETAVYTPAGRGPGKVEILVEKEAFRAAALPSADNATLQAILGGVYPQVTIAENVLDTSLNNVGGIVHPAAMLLSSKVTEESAAGQPRIYYVDQVNPTVADLVMEPLDAERVAVGRALGLRSVLTFREWSLACFHHARGTIRETVASNPSYLGFGAPKDLLALGFVDDEVPNSLVPLSELGRLVGVPTPMTDALIDLAAAMLGVDFRRTGRTLERLGLHGLAPAALLDHVNQARTRAPVLVVS